jgi:rhodanese-related sulfurtransferase
MSIHQLPPAQLEAFLQEQPDAILLDVREPWEHELAALEGSTLLPLGSLPQLAEDELEEKGRPIVVYCHHGIRSMNACAYLASLGYTKLHNLSGGIDRYTLEVDPGVPRY